MPLIEVQYISTLCHSYILTGLLTTCAGPDPRLYLNSTREFDKVTMKSVDLVTSPHIVTLQWIVWDRNDSYCCNANSS